jgi:glyoxylate/hydroxypyruvate reductase A
MRIHIQNHPAEPVFAVTPELWAEAATRAGERGLRVSFGLTPEEFREALAEAEVLIAAPATLAQLLPVPAPRLRLIFCTAAGVDALAPFTSLPPGAVLVNNRGVHGAKAGEYAVMALLMLANRMPALATAQRNRRWEKHHGSLLAGRRLTIVGLGDMGAHAAELAARFGMEVTGIRARPVPHFACVHVLGPDALDTCLPRTEFLLLACPLTAATRGLLNRERIFRLPRGAGVVNIGRGELIDEAALHEALLTGHLSGAVLDVFTEEPLPAHHPFWETPNLILTPHVSADDPARYIPASLDIFFANLQAWREGRPLPNQVDLARGY